MKYGVVDAGQTIYLKSRITDAADDPLLTADVSAITVAIDGGAPSSVVVADVWYDALQSWDEDGTGCNFIHALAAFPAADTIYTVAYTITTVADGTLTVTFTVRTLAGTAADGYCDRADIENQFGVANVGKWADLENRGDDALIAERITLAINWAKSEVDDRLRGGPYEVPLTTCPAITYVAATLAGVWLYESRGIEDFDEASGKPTHKLAFARDRAERTLADIRAGKRRIDVATVGVGARAPFAAKR